MSTDDEIPLPRPRPHRESLPPDEPTRHSPGSGQPDDRPRSPDGAGPADGTSAHHDAWHGLVLPGADAPEVVGRTLESVQDALVLVLGLVGRDRSGPPTLWFVVLDAHDRVLPVVLPIPDVPTIADPAVATDLVHVLASVIEHDAPGGSLLVGYARRGGGDRGAFESGWSAALRDAASRAGVRVRAEIAVGLDRARVLDPRW
jgi:hypothetical protein